MLFAGMILSLFLRAVLDVIQLPWTMQWSHRTSALCRSVTNYMIVLSFTFPPPHSPPISSPQPKESCVTRWRQDEHARGSYSYVAAGSSGNDYDFLAAAVSPARNGPLVPRPRVFFGGKQWLSNNHVFLF